MMNKKQILLLDKTLARLQEGDLYTPVETDGCGEYHAIATKLESLRVSMLKLKDSVADATLRTNKTVASAAHDMKTPLSIISGYAECISDGMDDKDYAALIMQKAEQMNEMVIGMVDSSNLEIKKQSEHRTLHGTRSLFGGIIERFRALAEAKNITLKVGKIDDVQIRADESQIERVVQNLVSNAVKYSDENTTIKITARRRGKHFVFCVKDQGVGISQESLPYVFDQFYTEDKSRSSGNSQGVGLYVVDEIVKAHGGSVKVKSKKGKGSVFSVALPIEFDDSNRTFTAILDDMPRACKIILEIAFGGLMSIVYRIAKFTETLHVHTLVAGIACFGLFMFMWPLDVVSVIVYGKITYLAD